MHVICALHGAGFQWLPDLDLQNDMARLRSLGWPPGTALLCPQTSQLEIHLARHVAGTGTGGTHQGIAGAEGL